MQSNFQVAHIFCNFALFAEFGIVLDVQSGVIDDRNFLHETQDVEKSSN